MKKYIFYNPAISSLNKGDEIIAESCKNQLKSIVNNEDFVVEICTHLPLLNYYLKILGEPNISFVLGSNLLSGKMNRVFKQWFVLPHNLKRMKKIVLMGVGWRAYNEKPNLYTRILYKKMLNGSFVHSVRDEYTKKMLNSIGINNVINTGCPTMWGLTKKHCSAIPTSKSSKVVFTLTDYNQNQERDLFLIKVLSSNYEQLFFWCQGSGDSDYLNRLISGDNNIIKIDPTVDSYKQILSKEDCDYVGTRLHAGIMAMQFSKRSIIIGIDNRALELKRDYNINVIEETELDKLENLINSELETNVSINEEGINEWLSQFRKVKENV